MGRWEQVCKWKAEHGASTVHLARNSITRGVSTVSRQPREVFKPPQYEWVWFDDDGYAYYCIPLDDDARARMLRARIDGPPSQACI